MWNFLLGNTGKYEWIIREYREAGVSEKENKADEKEPNDTFWADYSATGYQMQYITYSWRASF